MPHVLGLFFPLEHGTWYPLRGRQGYLPISYGSLLLVIVALRKYEKLWNLDGSFGCVWAG